MEDFSMKTKTIVLSFLSLVLLSTGNASSMGYKINKIEVIQKKTEYLVIKEKALTAWWTSWCIKNKDDCKFKLDESLKTLSSIQEELEKLASDTLEVSKPKKDDQQQIVSRIKEVEFEGKEKEVIESIEKFRELVSIIDRRLNWINDVNDMKSYINMMCSGNDEDDTIENLENLAYFLKIPIPQETTIQNLKKLITNRMNWINEINKKIEKNKFISVVEEKLTACDEIITTIYKGAIEKGKERLEILKKKIKL